MKIANEVRKMYTILICIFNDPVVFHPILISISRFLRIFPLLCARDPTNLHSPNISKLAVNYIGQFLSAVKP